jgi:Helix-turn-helix domain
VSIKVQTLVWDYSKASGTPLLVLLKLADWANDDGECWPSIRLIAEKCRLKDERHVKRLIRDELEEKLGEVVVIPNGGRSSHHGGPRSNRYIITIHMPNDEGVDNGTRVVEGPPSSNHQGGQPHQPRVVETRTRVVEGPPEPSLEPPNEPPLYPQPNAGDQKPARYGMRGTGTSPRERRAAARAAADELANEVELDRLVSAIPTTYANHPDIAAQKINETFEHDPERRQGALEHLHRMTAVAS